MNAFSWTPEDEDQYNLFFISIPGAQPFNIGAHIPAYGCNFGSLFNTFFSRHQGTPDDEKNRKRLYMRFYRKMNDLKKEGLISTEKRADGLIYAALQGRGFYLMRGKSYSNQADPALIETPKKPRTVYDIPKRARIERVRAVTKLQLQPALMTPGEVENITDHFTDYMEDCDDKCLVLAMKDDGGRADPDNVLTLPYKNRFNNEQMKVHNLQKFDRCWEEATRRYDRAVFLTLTTDPKLFSSNWEANRHFQIAWNRYLSYLTKYLGYRPKYITGFEFTQKGLLHCHAVIFGLDWLTRNETISRDWQRCGQGQITHIYSIRKDGLTGKWVWGRKKPKDGQRDPASYLKKYLKKAMYGDDEKDKIDQKTGKVKIDTFCLYWAINKRFFSYSRIFDTLGPLIRSSTGLWLFIGSCYTDHVPVLIQEESRRYIQRLRAASFLGIYNDWQGAPTE